MGLGFIFKGCNINVILFLGCNFNILFYFSAVFSLLYFSCYVFYCKICTKISVEEDDEIGRVLDTQIDGASACQLIFFFVLYKLLPVQSVAHFTIKKKKK